MLNMMTHLPFAFLFQLSWADIFFAGIIEYLSSMCGSDIVKPYPTLKSLAEQVYSNEKIKAYIAQRPDN